MNILTLNLNRGYSSCYVFEHIKGTLYDFLNYKLCIHTKHKPSDITVIHNTFNILAEDYMTDEFESEDVEEVRQNFKKVSRPFEMQNQEMSYCFFGGDLNDRHGWFIMRDGQWREMDVISESKNDGLSEEMKYWIDMLNNSY